MNNIFEFDIKDFIEFASNSYKTDPSYNSNLDIEHIIKVTKKESTEGAEREIKIKQNLLVCKKGARSVRKKQTKYIIF